MAGAPTDQEVIDLTRCPDCTQARGSRCVYMPVPFPSSANADKVGQPTQRVHRGRRAAARGVLRRRQREEALSPPPRTLPARVVIAQAEAEHDRRERVQLVRWLAQHGHVLTCPPA